MLYSLIDQRLKVKYFFLKLTIEKEKKEKKKMHNLSNEFKSLGFFSLFLCARPISKLLNKDDYIKLKTQRNRVQLLSPSQRSQNTGR